MRTSDTKPKLRDRGIPRTLTVKSVANITPNMRRVTLQSDPSDNFPPDSEGAFMKLLFKQKDNAKATMRTYTLSQQRSALNEVDIDFMIHTGDDGITHGVAAPWSLTAEAGDAISLFGPGPAKYINPDADYFLLAADMTALPALSANLKLLSDDAKGKAFIEVLSGSDKQDLPKPENVELIWVINDEPGSDESPLFHAIKDSDWRSDSQDGKRSVWSACEFKTMRKIRHYLKVDCEIERSHLYISSYWKKGNTEEEHKAVRLKDKEEAKI